MKYFEEPIVRVIFTDQKDILTESDPLRDPGSDDPFDL